MGLVELVPDVRVGDRIWIDADRNGLQDSGEEGVPDVMVTLYDNATGDVVGTAFSDANGNYLFDELYPGDYYVKFDLSTIPDNYAVTEPDATNDQSPETSDQSDSDVDPETGISQSTGILFSGEEDMSLDLGIYQIDSVAVGDQVWYDLDGDGLQDVNQPGVENISVMLYDTTTRKPVPGVPTQQTDRNGNYLFEDLPAGDYYVVFDLDTLPDGYGVTTPNATNDQQPAESDELDSDVNPANGSTAPTGPLSGRQTDTSLDMGIVKLPGVTIGDKVWFDDNGDGVQDPTEDGVPGITVHLYDALTGDIVVDASGTPLIQVTDGDGEYLFEDMDPGQYYVVFDLESLPTDYIVSPVDAEPSNTADSDADETTGATPPTMMLMHGESDRTLDMGIYKPIQIGDRVWFDDGNGQQDPGEAGVPNVGATLYDAETGEVVATTTTDEAGNYLFAGLPPGDYFIEFDPATLPEGFHPTRSDVGDDNDDSDIILDPSSAFLPPSDSVLRTPRTGFINSGEEDLSLDMGIVQPVEIGDFVWFDEDADGIQTGSELSFRQLDPRRLLCDL